MKNKLWIIVLISYLLIIIGLYIYDKESIMLTGLIFLTVGLSSLGFIYLRKNQLDNNKVIINPIDEKNIKFYYEDIYYEIVMDNFFVTRSIPIFDNNGKKVNNLIRNDIKKYLLNNYNQRKMENGINYITNDKILNTLTGFQPCNNDIKKEIFISSILHTKLWGVFILIGLVVFLLLGPTIADIKESGFTIGRIMVLVIFSVLLLIGILFGIKHFIDVCKSTMYYKKMFVYEQNSINGDDGPSCFLRFWDNEKNVLYKWFEVSVEEYNHPIGTPVFIYVLSLPKRNYVTFRFIDEKKED